MVSGSDVIFVIIREAKSNKSHKMATLDDSPLLHLGQPWTLWAEKIESMNKRGKSSPVTESKRAADTSSMKLRKEDMGLYGLCPAQDELYLVVCDKCGQVIKPQALQIHMDQRHSATFGLVNKMEVDGSHEAIHNSDLDVNFAPHSIRDKTVLLSSNKHDQHGKMPHKIRNGKNAPVPVVEVQRISLNSKSSNLPSSGNGSDSEKSASSEHSNGSSSGWNTPASSPVSAKQTKSNQGNFKSNSHSKTLSSANHSKGLSAGVNKSGSFGLMSKHGLKSAANSASKHLNVQTSKQQTNSVPKRSSQLEKLMLLDDLGSSSNASTHSPELLSQLSSSPVVSQKLSLPTRVPVMATEGGMITSSSSSLVCRPTSLPVQTRLVSSPTRADAAPSAPKSRTIIDPVDYKLPKIIPCKDRKYDPNIHCGVAMDGKAHCTRSLTCKTHSLAMRRAVQDRRKSFDELLKEHKGKKEAYLRAKAEAESAAGIVRPAKTKAKVASSLPPPSPVAASPVSTQIMSPTPPLLPMSPEQEATNFAVQLALAPGGGLSRSKVASRKVLPSPLQPAVPLSMVLNRPMLPSSPRPAPLPMLAQDEPSVEHYDFSSDEDLEENTLPLSCNYINHHPRPAAVNDYGGRLAGSGCYLFNRRSDLLRAAFMMAVERHLHPPPHKKMCLESKPGVNSKDPYEFQTLDGLHSAKTNRIKNKQKASPVANRRHSKDSGSKGLVSTGSLVSSTNQPTAAVKRKRSGSSPSPAQAPVPSSPSHGLTAISHTNPNNPISIAIPQTLQLNLASTTLSNISVTTPTRPQQPNINSSTAMDKSKLFKDLNFVVANVPGSEAGVANGQLLGTTVSLHGGGTSLANPLQYTSSSNDKQAVIRGKNVIPPSRASQPPGKATVLGALSQDAVIQGAPIIKHLSSGRAVMMDASGSTVLAPVSIAPAPVTTVSMLGSSAVSPAEASQAGITPSNRFYTGSSSPSAGEASPLSNGVVPSQHATSSVTYRTLPVHSSLPGSVEASPASRTPSPMDTGHTTIHFHQQHRGQPPHGRGKSKASIPGSQQVKVNVGSGIATTQANLLQGQRILTTTMAQNTIYTPSGQVLSVPASSAGQISHIHIQPKQGHTKLVSNKLAVQPVLALMAPPNVTMTSQTQQGQTLLLHADDVPGKHDIHHAHASASNFIS